MTMHFEIKANGHKVNAYCNCKNDRYGFTHVCELYLDGYHETDGRARWINCTWETFAYETALRNAIENAAALVFDLSLDYWKRLNGVSRMAKKQKALFAPWYISSDNPYKNTLETWARCSHWIACNKLRSSDKKPRFNFKKYVFAPYDGGYNEIVRGY